MSISFLILSVTFKSKGCIKKKNLRKDNLSYFHTILCPFVYQKPPLPLKFPQDSLQNKTDILTTEVDISHVEGKNSTRLHRKMKIYRQSVASEERDSVFFPEKPNGEI